MIISNGGSSASDTIEILYADEVPLIKLDTTRRVSAGGDYKTIPTGERFALNVSVRVNNTNLRTLLDIIMGGSETLYYTPEEDYSTLYPTVSFPLKVSMTNYKISDYSGIQKYITFSVESVAYIIWEKRLHKSLQSILVSALLAIGSKLKHILNIGMMINGND